MLSAFVLLTYSTSSNKYLVGQDSKNISGTSDISHSTQGDPEGSPKKNPQSNKPNKSDENSNNLVKSPVYPHVPVKVYPDAAVSKSDIYKYLKDLSIIYMWFNKITGRVYIGSAVNGSKRLSTYYQPSVCPPSPEGGLF